MTTLLNPITFRLLFLLHYDSLLDPPPLSFDSSTDLNEGGGSSTNRTESKPGDVIRLDKDPSMFIS